MRCNKICLGVFDGKGGKSIEETCKLFLFRFREKFSINYETLFFQSIYVNFSLK